MDQSKLCQRAKNWNWTKWRKKTVLNTNAPLKTVSDQVWRKEFLSQSRVLFDTFKFSASFDSVEDSFHQNEALSSFLRIVLGVNKRFWSRMGLIHVLAVFAAILVQAKSNGEFELFLELRIINSFAEVPKISPFSFPQRLATGSKATVTCTTSSGSAPLSFMWLKDGQELQSHSDIEILSSKSSSFFEITKIQEHHDGKYTCKVSNRFGSDSFTAPLEIECELF